MGILRNLCILSVSLLLTGCFEEFTPEIDVKPVLCLNSLITSGEPITVSVTHTRLFTDTSSYDAEVEDAVVHISVNGNPVDESYIAKDGDHIRIEVESQKYGYAEAEVDVPFRVPVSSLTFTPVATSVSQLGSGSMVGLVSFNLVARLEIKDPGDRMNYYRFTYSTYQPVDSILYMSEEDPVEVTRYGYVSFFGGTFHDETEPIFSEHIGVFESAMGASSYGSTFFTDRQFSGGSYKLSLYFTDGSYYLQSGGDDPGLYDCGYDLKLHSISSSYYYWENYLWQKNEGYIGDLVDMGLADPMCGYSNVSTGAGVVAAQSVSVARIDLNDFLRESIRQIQYVP